MSTKLARLIFSILLVITESSVNAQTLLAETYTSVDSLSVSAQDLLPAKKKIFKKILDYFNDANKGDKNKKFDFSIIGGPHYSKMCIRDRNELRLRPQLRKNTSK